MRYTRKDVEAAFRRVMRAMNAAKEYNLADVYSYAERREDGWHSVPGFYALSYAAEYGGYCIVQCTGSGRPGEGTGERHITMRMPARQFCEAADFMAELLADKAVL